MGRFGIAFADDEHYIKIMRNRLRAMEQAEGIETEEVAAHATDGPFQRTLAWTSYFVMVFVALCVFNQPAMAGAIDATTDFLPGYEASRPIDQWSLRGSL
jgi:hypothetical protein